MTHESREVLEPDEYACAPPRVSRAISGDDCVRKIPGHGIHGAYFLYSFDKGLGGGGSGPYIGHDDDWDVTMTGAATGP